MPRYILKAEREFGRVTYHSYMLLTTHTLGRRPEMNTTRQLLTITGLSILLGCSSAANATAVNYTWDFTGGVNEFITTGPSGSNVSYDFQSAPAGNPLAVQAFRLRDNGATFQWSRVHRNANNGLGVWRRINDENGDPIKPNSATIDNLNGFTDLLLFDFGVANLFDEWTIDFTVNTANDNASIWVGNGLASGDDLDLLNFNTLVSSAGFTVIDGNLSLSPNLSNDPYNFSTPMPYQYLVISANPNQDNDNFRIGSISASGIAQVPEPGTLLLFAVGLLGFTIRRGVF